MNDDYLSLMSPWHERDWTAYTGATAPAEHSSPSGFSATIPTETLTATRALVRESHQKMLDILSAQLLGYVYAQSSGFFEHLIVDMMVALGYVGRRRDMARKIGRSHDGGIDAVIEMDELGFEAIYLQAKRLKPGSVVSVSAVREFAGALEAFHATKGVFVTTGNFTPAALAVVAAVSKKIVLINGQRLTELMVRHNVGTRTTDSLQFKELDMSYFTGSTISPASTQPRK